MKKLSFCIVLLTCSLLIACGKGDQINGHNTKTAYRSVKALKNRLPANSRIEFEVAFWAIRDANKDDAQFLDVVDGKKPEEIINLGKEIYQKRKDEGFAAYSQYKNWEDMISKFSAERDEQDIKGKKKEDAKDKANDVLYKL
jgi:hypothetical protein